MTDREKLIALLESVEHARRLYPDLYVDMLIANGVVVREKGEWVETDYKPSWYRKCSLCGYRIDAADKSDFCPGCGADMRGAVKNG